MSENSIWDEIEAERINRGFDGETVVLDDDDVEAHGMLGVVAAVAILAGSAGGTMLADAGTALAPEPAQLTQSMTGPNSASAIYISTNTPTTVRYVGTSVIYAPTLAVGTPCTTYWPVPAGTVTGKVVQAYGGTGSAYRRCY